MARRAGLTLSTLTEGESFSQRITVKILGRKDLATYSTQTNAKAIRIEMVIADESAWRRCYVTNAEHDTKLQTDSTILIKNFTLRDNILRITMNTTVYRTSAGMMAIPPALVAEAIRLQDTPASAIVTIAEANRSPTKKISVAGRVISDEAVRSVNVDSTPTKVRDLIVQDKTDKIRVTLWRDSTSISIPSGSNVLVKDVQVKQNKYYKAPSLSVTCPCDVVVSETQADETQDICIQGLASTEIKPKMDVLATVGADDMDVDVEIDSTLLRAALALPDTAQIDDILAMLPFNGSGKIVGKQIVELI